MAATTASMGSLPSGLAICTTAPDVLYLPELVSGGTRAEGQAANLEVHQQGNRNVAFLPFFCYDFRPFLFFYFFFKKWVLSFKLNSFQGRWRRGVIFQHNAMTKAWGKNERFIVKGEKMKQEHLHLLTCPVSLILYVCERWKNAANTGQKGRWRGELLWGVMLFCYEWCCHLFLLSFLWANIDSGPSCPALRHGKSGFLPARVFQNRQDQRQNGKRKCCTCGPMYGFCSSLWKWSNFKIGYRQFWWKYLVNWGQNSGSNLPSCHSDFSL